MKHVSPIALAKRLFDFSKLMTKNTFTPRFPKDLASKILGVISLLTFSLSISCMSIYANAQSNQETLPAPVKKALKAANLPESSISFSIRKISAKTNSSISKFDWQSNVAMNPASTMKLVTSLAALDLLGPQYRWKTNVYTNGNIQQGVLQGDLIWQGSGDPKLIPEELSKIMASIRQLGINQIDGDLIFDRSAYAPETKSSAPGDGESQRSYNVAPDPLLYAFQTISFRLNNNNGEPEVSYTPRLANLKVNNKLQNTSGGCGDWTKLAKASVIKSGNEEWTASFLGKLPKQCKDLHWNIVAIGPDDFLKQGLMAAWEDAGGEWKRTPQVKPGKVPTFAKLLVSHQGTVLGDAVKDVNKYSNNVMARHLFLTIALEKTGKPATIQESDRLTREWLKKNQLNIPELVIENGSGLSNIERISAQNMTQVLTYSLKSKYHDVFLHSLPIAGTDGTMRNRLIDRLKSIFIGHANAANGDGFKPDITMPQALQKTGAFIKTGSLSSVRSIAGFVVSKSGEVYAISSMINHAQAAKGGIATQDALLSWLLEGGMDD